MATTDYALPPTAYDENMGEVVDETCGNQEDKRKRLQRKLSRMISSLNGNTLVRSREAPQVVHIKVIIRVGHYDGNVLRNALNLAVYGGKRWVTERVEVWDELDQRVYVRSLAKALAQQVGHEGVLRKDDSGDRLNPELSLQKNSVYDAATLKFDVTRARRTRCSSAGP